MCGDFFDKWVYIFATRNLLAVIWPSRIENNNFNEVNIELDDMEIHHSDQSNQANNTANNEQYGSENHREKPLKSNHL